MRIQQLLPAIALSLALVAVAQAQLTVTGTDSDVPASAISDGAWETSMLPVPDSRDSLNPLHSKRVSGGRKDDEMGGLVPYQNFAPIPTVAIS